MAVGGRSTSIPQRAWEIRVDSVFRLARAVKRESHDDNDEEVTYRLLRALGGPRVTSS